MNNEMDELISAVLEGRDADALNAAAAVARDEDEAHRLLAAAEAFKRLRLRGIEDTGAGSSLLSLLHRLAVSSDLTRTELATLSRQLDELGEDVTASALRRVADQRTHRR